MRAFWLAGFDASCLYEIYGDKPMQAGKSESAEFLKGESLSIARSAWSAG
jgi:hypothetical protein